MVTSKGNYYFEKIPVLDIEKHELRVAGSSWELKNMSWNSKVRVWIHEFNLMIYEFKYTSWEFKSTSSEFKNHLIDKNSSKLP